MSYLCLSIDESSPSGPQMVPAAAPSVSNPPSPSEDGQSHPMVMGEERRLMLRPIGTERTNKRPNSMTGSSCVMPPGAGDLQQWPFSQGSGKWLNLVYNERAEDFLLWIAG